MMNITQLRDYLAPLGYGTAWRDKCIQSLKAADNLTDILPGLVRRYGEHSVHLTKKGWDLWGIDIATCSRYCGRDSVPLIFDYPIFIAGLTNYVLPWLGLTAQLPFENGSPVNTIMSFCLAIGSPMLATFSLIWTAFNSYWISERFDTVIDQDPRMELAYQDAAKLARTFFQAAQQSSLRIHAAELSRLFASPPDEFREWWLYLSRRLEKTRRLVTFSLIAQVLIAVIAWAITIATSFFDALGIPSQALLFSSGTVWLWLIPNVVGWVLLKMQAREDTIHDALQECSLMAIEARSGLANPGPVRDALWGNVIGDERLQGPVFNYARIFTYEGIVETIASQFEGRSRQFRSAEISVQRRIRLSTSNNSEDNSQIGVGASSQIVETLSIAQPTTMNASPARRTGRPRNESSTPLLTPDNRVPLHGLRSSTSDVELTTPNSSDVEYQAYPEWTSLSSAWKRRFGWTTVLALLLPWGVIGSAVIISIMTEVRGLSCHSGSYILYGLLGTLVFGLQLGSVFLSHQGMLMMQRQGSSSSVSVLPQGRSVTVYKLAVLTRYAGKTLAALNTIWILVSAIWELIGMYESCFCTGSQLYWGGRAWVILFVTPGDVRASAGKFWGIGVAISFLAALTTFVVVWKCSRKIG